jgi:hypothetical protein
MTMDNEGACCGVRLCLKCDQISTFLLAITAHHFANALAFATTATIVEAATFYDRADFPHAAPTFKSFAAIAFSAVICLRKARRKSDDQYCASQCE